MDGKIEVRARESSEQPVSKHGARTGSRFFSGLSDHHQRARPALAVGSELAPHARPDSHMNIVPAGVSDWSLLALSVSHLDTGGERQSGRFLHWQRVLLGADQHGGSRPIPEERHDAVPADMFGDLESRHPCFGRQPLRGPDLLAREFAMAMERPI